MTFKRLFQIFSIGLVTMLVSCEECKDCQFDERTFYSNNPAISEITNSNFSKIDYFKTVEKNDILLDEVCGDNLDNIDSKVTIDTTYLDRYIDNSGNQVIIPGGVTRLITKTFSCK